MTGAVEVPEGFAERIRPYGQAVRQVIYRLQIARDVADLLAKGRAVTTDFIDFETCWWQLQTSLEQLAEAIAAFRGLPTRELVFDGAVPDWVLEDDAILPDAIAPGERGYVTDPILSLNREELRAIRNHAASALQLKPVHIFSDREGARELREVAEEMRRWLLRHALLLPDLGAAAIFSFAGPETTCSLVRLNIKDAPAEPTGSQED